LSVIILTSTHFFFAMSQNLNIVPVFDGMNYDY
jgi:hypothetical protein